MDYFRTKDESQLKIGDILHHFTFGPVRITNLTNNHIFAHVMKPEGITYKKEYQPENAPSAFSYSELNDWLLDTPESLFYLATRTLQESAVKMHLHKNYHPLLSEPSNLKPDDSKQFISGDEKSVIDQEISSIIHDYRKYERDLNLSSIISTKRKDRDQKENLLKANQKEVVEIENKINQNLLENVPLIRKEKLQENDVLEQKKQALQSKNSLIETELHSIKEGIKQLEVELASRDLNYIESLRNDLLHRYQAISIYPFVRYKLSSIGLFTK